VTIQAAAGVMSVTGEPGGAPVKCGVPISDFAAGLYAAMTILAMVHRVRAGGPGGQIDVPMFGTTLAIAALQTSQYFGTGLDPVAFGSAHPRNAPYQAFKAKDDYFVLAAGNERLWQQVCEMVGAPELASHPLYSSTALRAQNQQSLKELLESYFALQSSAHWLARCRELGIPSSPIQTYSGALADPQAQHYGLVRSLPMPGGGQSKTVGCPIWIDGQVVEVSAAIPPLSSSSSSSAASKPSAPSTLRGSDPQ
jgi:crotonobetainyl-CoA:carnitine CoA-transferase CaiB-like acyl-CoA transferase